MKSRSADIMKTLKVSNVGSTHSEFLTKQKTVMPVTEEGARIDLINGAIKDLTYTVQDVVMSLRAGGTLGMQGSISWRGVMSYQCKDCRCKVNVAVFISIPEVCPKCGKNSTLLELPNRTENIIFHKPDYGVSLETFETAYQQVLLERKLTEKQRNHNAYNDESP